MDSFHEIVHAIAASLFHLGGLGLVIIGVVDSSFLTMPLANDLLVVSLSAAHHERFWYYALMATVGSTAGCFIVDLLSRKAESGVRRQVSSRRLKFVESQVRKRAGWALAVASLVPPPFPFTPFVVAAAASGYPRRKLLSIVAILRMVRFSIGGLLGVIYGNAILSLAQSPAVEYTVLALIALTLAGCGVSIYRWARRPRSPA